MRLADTPAGQHDLVAGIVTRILRGLDGSRKVDSRHVGIVANEAAARPHAEPVLVVDGGVIDRDRHVARGQLILGQRLHRNGEVGFAVLFDD